MHILRSKNVSESPNMLNTMFIPPSKSVRVGANYLIGETTDIPGSCATQLHAILQMVTEHNVKLWCAM